MYNDVGTYQFQCCVTNPVSGCQTCEIITLTIGVIPPAPACINIYASTTGSASAAGTLFDPVTLEEAISRSSCNNAVIKVATGNYVIDNPLNITSLMTLEGGLSVAIMVKTPEPGATTITRSANNAGGVLNLDRHLIRVEAFGATNFRYKI